MSASRRAIELVRVAAAAADNKKADNILAIDVADRLGLTDAFLIASGNNERQVSAIVDEIEAKLIGADARPIQREGLTEGRWVLLDYGDIVVHILHAEDRTYYGLERLWKDCPAIDVALVGTANDAAGGAGSARESRVAAGAGR